MSLVVSPSDKPSRSNISMNEASIHEMTGTAGGVETEGKRHTRTNPPEVVVPLDVEDFSSLVSSSSSSRTIRPIGAKELEHAPRLDECIARLLSEMEDVKVPSPSFLTTRIRGGNNNRKGLVSALRLYPVQEVLAPYISMKDLQAIACTSSVLSKCLDLKETKEMWENKIKDGKGDKARKLARREAYFKALENMPEPQKRKLDEDEGEEIVYAPPWRPQSRGPKRIRAVFGHV